MLFVTTRGFLPIVDDCALQASLCIAPPQGR